MKVENDLQYKKVLGKDTPDKLNSTVLFLLGLNMVLMAGDEHNTLRHPGGCATSQFSLSSIALVLDVWVLILRPTSGVLEI